MNFRHSREGIERILKAILRLSFFFNLLNRVGGINAKALWVGDVVRSGAGNHLRERKMTWDSSVASFWPLLVLFAPLVALFLVRAVTN
jgi:hypothetical protein